ncbi:4401_t:CDS:1, partial [Funneliformis geosporum]
DTFYQLNDIQVNLEKSFVISTAPNRNQNITLNLSTSRKSIRVPTHY